MLEKFAYHLHHEDCTVRRCSKKYTFFRSTTLPQAIHAATPTPSTSILHRPPLLPHQPDRRSIVVWLLGTPTISRSFSTTRHFESFGLAFSASNWDRRETLYQAFRRVHIYHCGCLCVRFVFVCLWYVWWLLRSFLIVHTWLMMAETSCPRSRGQRVLYAKLSVAIHHHRAVFVIISRSSCGYGKSE